MSSVLAELEPATLWKHFEALCSVPRPSGDEGRVREHLVQLAQSRGWSALTDAVGNVCLKVPATPGRESSAPLVLQAHLDMVCEKSPGSSFDFSAQPIPLEVKDSWVLAQDTTLGADNGIGLAAALAVCDEPDISHGPMELLFTVDEEASGIGAEQLDPQIVQGRRMLNLDSEDDRTLCVGCAGGAVTDIEYGIKRASVPKDYAPVRITVDGLRGGHSGTTIHENQGNALKVLARVLRELLAGAEVYLWSVEGGNKSNAIARDANAIAFVPQAFLPKLRLIAEDVREQFLAVLDPTDNKLRIELDTNVPERALPPLDCSSSRRLIRLMSALPHGVSEMSREVPGMVQTSTNFASVRTDTDRVLMVCNSRSLMPNGLRETLEQIDSVCRLAGAAAVQSGGYPSWRADLQSPLLGKAKAVYREIWGHDPKLETIHAGLECGTLAQRLVGLDVVSFGPNIEGAHAPGERVSIPSVQRFYKMLKTFVQTLD